MFFTMLRLLTRHPLRSHASPLTQVDDSGSTARWRNGNALSMISRNEDLRDLAPARSYRRHRVSAAFFLRQQLSIDHPARGRRFDLSRPPIEQAVTLAMVLSIRCSLHTTQHHRSHRRHNTVGNRELEVMTVPKPFIEEIVLVRTLLTRVVARQQTGRKSLSKL